MAASDMRSPPVCPTLRDRLEGLSSSPSFPDLQDLISTKAKPKLQTLRSGNAAAPIPADASTEFTPASELLRKGRAIGSDAFDVIDEPDPPVAKKAPAKRVRNTLKKSKVLNEPKAAKTSRLGKASKRVAKEVIVLSSDGVTPKTARHVDTFAGERGEQNAGTIGAQKEDGTPSQAKPWKKFKDPTSPEQTGTGESEAVSAKLPAKAKSQRKNSKPETVSRHSIKEQDSIKSENSGAKKQRPRASTPEPTNLEPAVKRRMDWTPAKPDTMIPQSSLEPFGTQGAVIVIDVEDDGSDATDLFKNLRDTYGHHMADADVVAAPKPQTTKVLGKRKVIEMVPVNLLSESIQADRKPSPAKEKAPKKKPRTITELATAPYAPKPTEEHSPIDDSLLGYFKIEDPEQGSSKGAVARSKGKVSKVTSKKKTALKKAVLLSPQSAIRHSAAQDFVFGTASQLARETSPTFLKDLHAAMKASTTAEDNDPFAKPSTGGLVRSKVRGKGLWSVSARDEEGEMVDVEIIDMVNSPALPQDDAILDPWTQLPPEAVGAEVETADSSVIEIDSRPVAMDGLETSPPTVPKSHFFTSQKMTLNAAAAILPKFSDESFPLVTELLEDEMPPPSNQQQTQEEVRNSPSKAIVPASKSRPKYETFTDVKLAKEISKFGFKAVKTRTGMIALLDKCWKRKSEASLAGASFSTSSVLASPKRKQTDTAQDSPATSSPPAKKPRGKAKKTADADAVVVEASNRARASKGSLVKDAPNLPKKKLGRPRKDAATPVKAAPPMPLPPKTMATPSTPRRKRPIAQAGFGVEDFDLDSEIEASGFSPEQLSSPSDANITINGDTEISLNFSPTAQQSTLLTFITKAVRSAPRTMDPEHPSWHEKMLMYDPIILEDLTAWLNSGELTKLGYDDEVAPQDVKKWCESRSICCLWKGNRLGKERKRF